MLMCKRMISVFLFTVINLAPILPFECDKQNNEEMKFYCVPCNQIACQHCEGESKGDGNGDTDNAFSILLTCDVLEFLNDHQAHELISLTKYVELVKEKWMNNVKDVINNLPSLSFAFLAVNLFLIVHEINPLLQSVQS